MKTKSITTLCALVLGLTTITVQGIPITDLFAGSTIESGDKLFADWELLGYGPAVTGPIDLSLIDVTALPSEVGSDNPGLLFEFGEPLGVVGLDETTLLFSYSVLVQDPTQQIVGSTLALTGFIAESFDPNEPFPDGSVVVTGHIDGFDFLNPDLEVFSDVNAFINDEQLFDSEGVGPTSSLTMDTLLIADGTVGTFQISSFEQRFDQLTVINVVPIPAPATFALFILGIAGLGWTRRKKPSWN